MIQDADSTRSRLLDAAELLFSEHGYDAVGIRQIADAAGVNLSGIKYHFGSKRGLYLDAIRRTMDRRGSTDAWSLLDAPISTPREGAEALRAFNRAFLHVLLAGGEEESCACMIMQAATQQSDATDLVVNEFIRPHHERLCQLVGVLCPDADNALRSRHAQSVLALLLHQRMFRPFLNRLQDPADAPLSDAPAIDALADELTAFALRGMGCEPPVQATNDQAEILQPKTAGATA